MVLDEPKNTYVQKDQSIELAKFIQVIRIVVIANVTKLKPHKTSFVFPIRVKYNAETKNTIKKIPKQPNTVLKKLSQAFSNPVILDFIFNALLPCKNFKPFNHTIN